MLKHFVLQFVMRPLLSHDNISSVGNNERVAFDEEAPLDSGAMSEDFPYHSGMAAPSYEEDENEGGTKLIILPVQSEGIPSSGTFPMARGGNAPSTPAPPQGEELKQVLLQQLEYYFSKDNLSSDKYLCKCVRRWTDHSNHRVN